MADPGPARTVLFLCTGNSARSILAECILNREGQGRFRAFSAGSYPAGKVNPYALALLKEKNFPLEGLRSKSWDEFAAAHAPRLDFIFTVCDNAAGELCPLWPGQPVTAHWGVPDPAVVTSSERAAQQAFRDAFSDLSKRIALFLDLPLDHLDGGTLQKKLSQIGLSA